MKSSNTLIGSICVVLVYFGGISMSLSADKNQFDYPVRDIPIDSEKFGSIYKTVFESELKMQGRNIMVVQNVGQNKYLIDVGNGDLAVLEVPPGTRQLADTEKYNVRMEETDRLHEYVSVTGANRRLRIYLYRDPPSKEEFATMLKNGATYNLALNKTEVKCNKCLGWGEISKPGSRVIGEKIDCSQCEKGVNVITNYYFIHW